MTKQEESNNMNSKIKILLLFMVLFVFGDCASEVRYSSQIINYDYRNFDGVLIYNRDSEVIIFELFRAKESGLVFVDSNLKIIKKPRNYILKDKEIIKLIRAYKRLKLSYCRIDYDKIIRVICNGIDCHDGLSREFDRPFLRWSAANNDLSACRKLWCTTLHH